MSEGQIKPKLTDDTIRKLSQAFSLDCSVKEACFYANISTDTYYRWIKEYPELSDEFERLRQLPIFKARMRVIKGIEESFDNALKYLKVKKRDEFGTAKPTPELKPLQSEQTVLGSDLFGKLLDRMNIHNLSQGPHYRPGESIGSLESGENEEV